MTRVEVRRTLRFSLSGKTRVCLWAFLGSLGMAAVPAAVAQQSWDFYYRLGLQQLRNGDPQGAIESLTSALQKGPPPGPRRLTADGRWVNFFPYLYLARAYLALKDCERARQMIEASVQKHEVPNDHPDYTLQFVPIQRDIQAECGAKESPPGPTPEPPKPTPPNPPAPAVPVEVLRQAVRLYRRGAYRDVVRLLVEIQRTYELDDGAYFLLGCGLASQYFWEGQRDRRLLQTARAYFQRVRHLPPTLEPVVSDLVSPKVWAVYEGARRGG